MSLALLAIFAAFLAVDSTDATPYQLSLLVAAALFFFAVLAMWKTHEVEVEPADVVDSGEKNTSLPLVLIGVISLVWLLRTGSEWTMRIFFNVYLDSELGACLNISRKATSSIFRIAPPLTVSEKEIDKAMSIFDQALRECAEQ